MAWRMALSGALVERPASQREGPKPTGGAEPGVARDIMQLDTWYDLAGSGLSERTDHAKEMLDEAEKAAPAASTPMVR